MSLNFKNTSFLNLNVMLSQIYFHVINITYIKNYVIFEPNIILYHVIFSCHLSKLMTWFCHKYFFISDLLTQLLNDES